MDAKALRLCKQAHRENRGRTLKARRYSERLREEIVEYWLDCQRRGARLKEVVEELGVSGMSLQRWVRKSPGDGFRRVELVPAATDERSVLSVVTPDGYRVDGLGVSEVARLLEALR